MRWLGRIVGALVVLVVGAGVAYALLGGTITGLNNVAGIATGGGNPCQATDVNWQWGSPAWDATDTRFEVSQLSYSGVSAACVTASATLDYAVVDPGPDTTIVSGQVTVSATTGTITLSPAIDASSLSSYHVNYFVSG